VTGGRADGSRVRTVFLGSGAFGRESLRRLAVHPDVRLVGVVTAPARPAGRAQRPTPTVIGMLAADLGDATVLAPGRLRAPEATAAVLALDPALLVLADYGQIVPGPLLEVPLGALNLHPSLLPRHRGASPIPATILAGDRETGVTLMRMDAGLDTGPIIAQTRHRLEGSETTPGLEAALEREAAALLERELGPWIHGERVPHPQPAEGATLTRPLTREDGRLDVHRPAVELWRQVRAYQPWPGSFVETTFGRLVVWDATAEAGEGGPPGRFTSDGLWTGAGRLRLREVQPAGGRRMSWEAFVRGRPAIVETGVVPPA
jgi:methionyl-tRNA formyltransferase